MSSGSDRQRPWDSSPAVMRESVLGSTWEIRHTGFWAVNEPGERLSRSANSLAHSSRGDQSRGHAVARHHRGGALAFECLDLLDGWPARCARASQAYRDG